VFSAFHQARGDSDEVLLQRAIAEERILITNDRDFGELIYHNGCDHRGVIFLRLNDERAANKIHAIQNLLAQHAGQLAGSFVVVTETQIRFAST
jgi:predicted nuclease of predicted toxin-antitoxin system